MSLIIWILVINNSSPMLYASEQINLEHKIENYLIEHEQDISGLATIVIHQDEVIYKMKGYADIENKIPVNEETVFEWASVSKVLIWISVFQLVEAGKLDLDRDIKTYLPEDFISKIKFKDPITMRHLMHHNAGFDDTYTDLMIHRPDKIESLRKVLEGANVTQVFSPGDVVAYSNYGSGLAAYIVEIVSGLDYREYVKENIFDPLQMTKTAIDPKQDDNKWVQEQREKVQGYSHTLQLIEPNLYSLPMYPVGSVMGSAKDLHKLLEVLLSEDGAPLFKDQKTIESLFEPTLNYPETDIPRIANGLFYLPSKSQHVYGHGGNSKAFSSSFYIDRKEQTGVIVLTNKANEITFTSGIPELVFGKGVPVEANQNLEDSSKWEGIYEPARLPRHGFSKIYGLFLRSHTKQSGEDGLKINDLHYAQLEPGIYKTEDDFNMYSLDVYSKHEQTEKMLSNTYSDLLYVSNSKHISEWTAVILALLAIVTSFLYALVSIVKIIRRKQLQSKLTFIQHLLNVMMFTNVSWIIYKTLSMVSYSFLQPFLVFNLLYVVVSFVISGVMITKIKNKRDSFMTIVFTLILCGNILYWEFYY